MKQFIFALGICLLAVAPIQCAAGECPDGEANYIAQIKGNCADCGEFDYYSLSCLTCFMGEGGPWAGPNAERGFRLQRESPLRPALIDAATAFLVRAAHTDTLRFYRRELARVLGCWGVDRVDSFVVYDTLVAGFAQDKSEGIDNMMALAGLRDPRTAGFIDSIYDSLRSSGPGDTVMVAYHALNCLYHIPGSNSVAVAKRILARESNPMLRERAEHVIGRPTQPDAK